MWFHETLLDVGAPLHLSKSFDLPFFALFDSRVAVEQWKPQVKKN